MRYSGDVDSSYFDGCEYVTWSPASFLLSGDWSVLYGAPALVLPIRIWAAVGVQRCPGNEFRFEMKVIRRTAPMFEESGRRDDSQYTVLTACNGKAPAFPPLLNLEPEYDGVMKALDEWRRMTGFDGAFSCKILCDIPVRCGLNSSAAIASCLAMICYGLEKGLSPPDLEKKLQSLTGKDLRGLLANKEFRRILAYSWYFDSSPTEHIKSCFAPLVSLVRSTPEKGLVLCFTEERGRGTNSPLRKSDFKGRGGYRLTSALKYFENMRIYASRLPLPKWFAHQAAFSLVYSQVTKSSLEQFESLDRWYTPNLCIAQDFLKSSFPNLGSEVCGVIRPVMDILKGCKDKDLRDYPQDLYSHCLALVALRMLDCLLGKEKSAPRAFREFIRENHALLNAFGVVGRPLHQLKRELLNLGQSDLWMKQVGAGDGGDLAVFGPHADIWELNGKLMSEFEKTGKARLHYSSVWRYPPVTAQDRYVLTGSETGLKFLVENRGVAYFDGQRKDLEEKQFLWLLLIAAARKSGKYTVNSDTDLDGTRHYRKLRENLPKGLRKKLSVKPSSGDISLSVEPSDIKVDPSVDEFESSHYKNLASYFKEGELPESKDTRTLENQIGFWLVQWKRSEAILERSLSLLERNPSQPMITNSLLFKGAKKFVLANRKSVIDSTDKKPGGKGMLAELIELIPSLKTE